ncbi:glycosyltransferase family 4 protein [Curtobacterium sp. MCBD17_028]|uniref:glycosyltransferase family 4 protein n=1 Tax=Curtobacterium sp. MCBD17_028 TaxID=2175670 RepID=UPI000DAA4FB7|nr:glycosyltransferase family 4 protein [Curtobacterium sp. MCBD17_028]PZE27897.1 hypothetical protein DEI86_04690 [Curtobacterium sp. MCBD17_028]
MSVKGVLYCHSSADGGAELAAPLLAKSLDLALWVRGDGALPERASRLGISVRRFRSTADSRQRSLLQSLVAVLQLAYVQIEVFRVLRRERPEVVLSNSVQGMLHLAVPCKLARVPLVCYVRDLGAGGNRPASLTRVLRMLTRYFAVDRVFNSELTRRSWRVAGIVVPTAVEDRFYSVDRAPADAPEVLMLGRIARWKGQDLAIEAVNEVTAAVPGVRMVIAGDAEFGDEFPLPRAEFPLEMRGHVVEVEALFRSAWVLVHASRTPEPFGQVLAQAAAAGVPIVCSDEGGQFDWLIPDDSCVAVDVRDTRAFGSAIASTLLDADRASVMARQARVASGRFRAPAVYEPIKTLLEGLRS